MLPRIPVITRGNIGSTLDNKTSMVVNSHTPVRLPKVCILSLSAGGGGGGGGGGVEPPTKFSKRKRLIGSQFFEECCWESRGVFLRRVAVFTYKIN